MIVIGVTGISGSGKTVVTRMLAEMGGYAIETDPMAHGLMRKGCQAFYEIVDAFGVDILDANGRIHRPALGAMVFRDKTKLALLESIIHPKVAFETTTLLRQAEFAGTYNFAIIDAPLLIEAGMHKMCDSCWLITANHETRLSRIIARDEIPTEAAEKRLSSRPGDEALKPYAHIVIENNTDNLVELKAKVTKALQSVGLKPQI